MSVSVLVLSEQIRDTEPRVSTAGRRRIIALRWAIRWTLIANVIVMSAGKPLGMTETAILTTAWKICMKGICRIYLPYRNTRTLIALIIVVIVYPNFLICRSNGVSSTLTDVIIWLMRPNSVFVPVVTTTPMT